MQFIIGVGSFSIDKLIDLFSGYTYERGWGIAYSVDRSFQVYKSPNFAKDDPRLKEHKGVRSPLVILCSGMEEGIQPFEKEFHATEYVFCYSVGAGLWPPVGACLRSDISDCLKRGLGNYKGEFNCLLAKPSEAVFVSRSRRNRLYAVLDGCFSFVSSFPMPGSLRLEHNRLGRLRPNGTYDSDARFS